MSDKPIAVGDLVMVVRAEQCGCENDIGTIFTVESVRVPLQFYCDYCRTHVSKEMTAYTGGRRGGFQIGFRLSQLKRIDPLSEPESTETREELHA